MNKELIIRRAYQKLVAQGQRGVLGYRTNTCAYRGIDGTRCLIGFEIPDDRYDPEWDNRNLTVDGLPRDLLRDIFEATNEEDVEWLRRLQTTHDAARNFDSAVARLESFASEHGIDLREDDQG